MSAVRQRGFTLLEVLLALAAGALLLSSVLPMLTTTVAAATNPATSEQADLERQAAFAIDRMARVVRAKAPAVLSPAQDPATTGPWLAPATFQLSGVKAPFTLVEKRAGDNVLHVLAESVDSVRFSALPVTDGRQLIQVELVLKSANAATSVTSVMRMGWLQ